MIGIATNNRLCQSIRFHQEPVDSSRQASTPLQCHIAVQSQRSIHENPRVLMPGYLQV
ncbi:hypothetical protein UUU_25070 (plasmid) [Klebsiella pneumoniae subsp. pneumoniae DSM 30104 = JCM 1662 = NBRC 14940]|nr:hypothetical protein UUU_25070 [Klebsiella pneumoniae subsp. pneumoniae DSM 30104 = JCM 1662 = NBRC 14940]